MLCFGHSSTSSMHFWFTYWNSCTVVHCMNELPLTYLFSVYGPLACFLIFFPSEKSNGGIAGSSYVQSSTFPDGNTLFFKVVCPFIALCPQWASSSFPPILQSMQYQQPFRFLPIWWARNMISAMLTFTFLPPMPSHDTRTSRHLCSWLKKKTKNTTTKMSPLCMIFAIGFW